MMRSIVVLLLIFGGCFSPLKAQLMGLVVDSADAPLAYVDIYDKTRGKLGSTGIDGYFKLEIRPGSYKLAFTSPEYKTFEIPYVCYENRKDTITIRMQKDISVIEPVLIKTKWKDPGPNYMRKAIEKRDFWASRIPSQSADVYIRAFEEITSKKSVYFNPENENKKPEKEEKNGPPKLNANLAEIRIKRDWQHPNKIKEIREGVSIRGDKSSLFYLSTTEGDFNIYQNLMNLPALTPLPIMSPLSNSAILAYRFRFIESYKDSIHGRVLKIKFDGRQVSNATFSGEIHLVDTLFYVSKIVLNVPPHLMAEYNSMTLSQGYRLTKDTLILIDSQRFDYTIRYGNNTIKGNTRVRYTKIQTNPVFPKNHFGLELSRTEQLAYERDSSYWDGERPVPLSMVERTFVNRSDSIQRVLNSDEYLDSIERKINKITLKSLFLEGQEYQNRRKGIELGFQPLWLLYQPWWPGGGRFLLWNQVNKTFENKKTISFNQNLSYGVLNNDLRGSVNFSTLYNPYKRKIVFASAGRDFGFVNPFAAYIDLFRRDNFYQHDHFSIYHRQELTNGLYFRIRGEISDRKDISNWKFSSSGDSLFENNVAVKFNSHKAIFANFQFTYTPFQRYISEPKQKVILGSKWPTFIAEYKKAITGIFNSTISYDYLEFKVIHEFPLGLLGRSEFRGTSGSFINKKNLSIIDYRYQRRGDPAIFTPPMYAFQTLDSTFSTFKRYYEFHYRHHFNGSLVNKIPFMKKLSLYESAGANLLYAPERRNLFFYEAYVGVDKLVRIWRERFKIGVYYCVGYSNLYETPRAQFKINFEYYDRAKNSW